MIHLEGILVFEKFIVFDISQLTSIASEAHLFYSMKSVCSGNYYAMTKYVLLALLEEMSQGLWICRGPLYKFCYDLSM